MKPDAIYVFRKGAKVKTRFLLTERRGDYFPSNFPAVYKRGEKQGRFYVGFRETVNRPRPGHRFFTHTVELDNSRTVTGLNFAPEYPLKAFGDYRGDALLIEFSDSRDYIKIMFYKGMAAVAQSLFQKWVTMGLPETTEADSLPLDLLKKAG